MAKVKVRALRAMYFHPRGAEFETSEAHARALVKAGSGEIVPPRAKRTYKRRDLTPESTVELVADAGEGAPE